MAGLRSHGAVVRESLSLGQLAQRRLRDIGHIYSFLYSVPAVPLTKDGRRDCPLHLLAMLKGRS